MNKQYKQAIESKQGFTIIEVVLVLAIAALIFLMVFIALPALQRGQRDTARKNEASTVLAAVNTYQGANRGANPTAPADIGKIINGNTTGVLDSGANIQIRASSFGSNVTLTPSTTAAVAADNTVALDEVLMYFGYKCGATSTQLVKGTSRQVAVAVVQEAGNGMVSCVHT